MTKIEITIQERDGKPAITWLEQQGDVLPQQLWDAFVAQTANVFNNQ